MFLIKNKKRIKIPGINVFKLDFTIKREYKKHKTGTQIIVGFMAKTKTEKAKIIDAVLFPDKISFNIIREKIITGKSGLGDCENNSKIGMKHN